MKDLTLSNIERQNVLNNNYALQTIQENLDVNGLRYHDQLLFTTKMGMSLQLPMMITRR